MHVIDAKILLAARTAPKQERREGNSEHLYC